MINQHLEGIVGIGNLSEEINAKFGGITVLHLHSFSRGSDTGAAAIVEREAEGLAHHQRRELARVHINPICLSCFAHQTGNVCQFALALMSRFGDDGQERRGEGIRGIRDLLAIGALAARVAACVGTGRNGHLRRVLEASHGDTKLKRNERVVKRTLAGLS